MQAIITSLGDPITHLTENMVAEQKARVTYENLIHMTEDLVLKIPNGYMGLSPRSVFFIIRQLFTKNRYLAFR